MLPLLQFNNRVALSSCNRREWERNPRIQLEQAMESPAHQVLHDGVAGNVVLTACAGRMPQAFAAQANSQRVGGTPLICAETSWLYYTWMLEYQGALAVDDPHLRQTMHVTRALTSEIGNNLVSCLRNKFLT